MSAATRSRTPDRLCADAVELAQQAAVEAASPREVGGHLGLLAEGDRLVTHFFESHDPAYRGWRWAVTVARASRARYVTVDEVTLSPGADALLAPDWLPWSQRLRPSDLGPGDLLPADRDDPRLAPGWSGEELPPPNSALPGAAAEWIGGPAAAQPAAQAGLAGLDVQGGSDTEPLDGPGRGSAGAGSAAWNGTGAEAAAGRGTAEESAGPWAVADNGRGDITAVAHELGMGRARVLSRLGLRDAAERWEEEYGPRTRMAESAPANCDSCGFLVPVTGSLSQEFGVCGNGMAPADGHVVSLAFGCGAHSEAAQAPEPQAPPQPVIDHVGADPL